MTVGDPSGGFGRTGPSSRVAFEEARARAEEQRARARSREGTPVGESARRILTILFAAITLGLMTYAVEGVAGPVAAAAALVLLLIGVVASWRLWR
jgi:hypothetical protein